jgi:hypothetical protein
MSTPNPAPIIPKASAKAGRSKTVPIPQPIRVPETQAIVVLSAKISDKYPMSATLPTFDCSEKRVKSVVPPNLWMAQGIVSKRRAAPYRSGECRDWVTRSPDFDHCWPARM